MESYELNNLKQTHCHLVREHAKLMQDITKMDDKKAEKKCQKEIDLLYKCIIGINKLLLFYREQEN